MPGRLAGAAVLSLLGLGVVAAPARAAIATPGQHAYVVLVNDTSASYTFPDTRQQVLDRIDQVLTR